MQEVLVKGKRRSCFMVKKGTNGGKNIVILLDSLTPLDYKRLVAVEAEGGEMMSAMNKTKADNGMNMLDLYKNILVEADDVPSTINPKELQKSPLDVSNINKQTEKTKRRGRPPKIKI